MDSYSSSAGSSKRPCTPGSSGQVVSCLVDGCKADLSKCRDYFRRHKVCEMHSKTLRVTIGGHEQRFCLKCCRFHSLGEFDEGKRSCRKRLEDHIRRRRKPQLEPLPMNYGNFLPTQPQLEPLPMNYGNFLPTPGFNIDMIPIAPTLLDIDKRDDEDQLNLKNIVNKAWNVLKLVSEFQVQGNETTVLENQTVMSLAEWCYHAEDLLDQIEFEKKKPKNLLEKKNEAVILWRRQDQSTQIRKVCKKINEILVQCEKLTSNQIQDTKAIPQWSTATDVAMKLDPLFGRDSDKREIVDFFSGRSEQDGISIVGMCGIGKSSLARTILQTEEIVSKFCTLWVNLPNGIFVWDYIKKEIEEVGSAWSGDKGLLIAFDNLLQVKMSEWYSFQNYRKELPKPIRIIVTTHNPTIPNLTRTFHYCLGLLSHDCCVEVIKENASYHHPKEIILDHQNKEKIESLAKKCEGLPLVAQRFGMMIGDWDNILKVERLSQTSEFKKVIFPVIFSSSYQGMTAELWRCVAYLSLFPVGQQFDLEDLVHLWVGEGFIPLAAGSSLKRISERYIDDLLERSIILQSSGGKCKLHSLGHEVAQLASLETCLQLDQDHESLSQHFNKNPRHVSSNFNPDIFYTLRGFEKLRTLLLHDGSNNHPFDNISFSVLQRNLRVLSLKGCNIDVIPSSISRLIHLRYLDISYTLVARLPEDVCRLHALLFLKLKGTHIHDLPKNFHNLTNLLHVDWDEFFIRELKGLYKIGKLYMLENLPLFVAGEREGYSISELKNMNYLQGSLCIQNLEYVKYAEQAEEAMLLRKCDLISIELAWGTYSTDSTHDEDILTHLEFHKDVEELRLINYNGQRIPKWISDSSLVKIHLTSCASISFIPALGKLRHLKTLILERMERITELSCHFPDDADETLCFPSLESLELYGLNNFERFTGVLSSDMPCLCHIKIEDCGQFSSLLSTTNNDPLHQLMLGEKDWSLIPKIMIDGEPLDIQVQVQAQSSSAPSHSWLHSSSAPSGWSLHSTLETSTAATSLQGIFDDEVCQVKLYCCLLPSDYEFERNRLVYLWMAMGLFQEPLENNGNNQFQQLLGEDFIIYSRTDNLTKIPKYIINADKVNTFSNELESRNLYAIIRDETAEVDMSEFWHVSLAVSESIEEILFKKLDQSKLRSVLLTRDYGSTLKGVPSSFFHTHQFMQALDLSGSHISELPSSIGNMTLLRFLDLSFTLIRSIPESIDELVELQTLKLERCKCLHMLPDGMIKLINLRHLDFDVLGQLTYMPEGMGLLTKLRTLSAFIVSEEDGCSLTELKDLNNLCGSFCISGLECTLSKDAAEAAMSNKNHLTRLHLKWSGSISYDSLSQYEAFSTLELLKPNASLQELQISYYPGSDFPGWIHSDDFTQLDKVTLFRCENKKFIELESSPGLKHLTITDMDEVAKIEHANADDRIKFPNLETLLIDGMRSLQSWTGLNAKDCPHLWKLCIKHCPGLTQLDFLPFLHSLRYLEISHCKSFESLPSDPLPTSLETLIINKCPLLAERYSKEAEDWKQIKDVPNISIDTIDMGSANQNRAEANFKRSTEEKGTTTMDECKEDIAHSGMFDDHEYQAKLFCRLFPSDIDFEKDTLVQLWMAMGLFREPLEHFGNLCFDHLLKQEFFTKFRDTKRYQMNVNKVATFSKRVEGENLYACIGDGTTTVDTLSKCRHVSLVRESIDKTLDKALFQPEKASELRTLLLLRDYGDSLTQIPSDFFKAHRSMQALDLSGSHISELHNFIGDMTLLHFLDLSFTPIQRVPESIERLGELQTLKLKGCKHLEALPRGIKNLVSLRHLDFDVLGKLIDMPEGMGLLNKLRTLSAFIVSENNGCSLGELKNLNNLCGSLYISGLEYTSSGDAKEANMAMKKYLTGLHLKWSKLKVYDDKAKLEASLTLECLKPNNMATLEELEISDYPGSEFPKWIHREDFKRLASVTLNRCENKKFIELESLSSLKHLKIMNMDEVENIDHAMHGLSHHHKVKFPNLVTLAMEGMVKLASWTGIVVGDFPLLVNLIVTDCPQLYQVDFLQHLCSLSYLEISRCKLIKLYLPADNLSTSLKTLIIDKDMMSKDDREAIIKQKPSMRVEIPNSDSIVDDTASVQSICSYPSHTDDESSSSTTEIRRE